MAIVRPKVAPCLVLVLLAGCKGCQSEEGLPALLEAEDATPVGVWVGEGLGASPVSVPVYATSPLGAVVPAAAPAVTVADASAAVSTTVGADGWGEAVVTAAGRGRY